jgi:hypothetical protein
MRIEVNVSKKYFFGLLLLGLMVVGFVGVYAYNAAGTGGTPSKMGHSVDEMDWSKKISGNISADGICIGSDCRTGWPASSQWTTFGNNIYYDKGDVGIGGNDSNSELYIASSHGGVDGAAVRAVYPGGGQLAGTEFGALAYRNGVWSAVYGKAGTGGAKAATFEGEVCIGGVCKNSWPSESPAGTLCGQAHDFSPQGCTANAYCKGYNPCTSCPPGYTRMHTTGMQIYAWRGDVYCVKI